jgi:hypothetical protein
LGATPGLIYAVRNMQQFHLDIVKAQDMAREGGDLHDIHFSFSLKYDLLLRPRKFIGSGDSAALRDAKQHLLSVKRKVLLRHALGALMTLVGSFVGAVVAVSI